MVSLVHSARSDTEYEDQIGPNRSRARFSSLKQSLYASSPSCFTTLQVLSARKLGMPLWANATALVSASAVANPIAARFMAFPYDHPRTQSACRGGVTDEKPRPAGQQQGGANQESARSHRALNRAYHRPCGGQFTGLRP